MFSNIKKRILFARALFTPTFSEDFYEKGAWFWLTAWISLVFHKTNEDYLHIDYKVNKRAAVQITKKVFSLSYADMPLFQTPIYDIAIGILPEERLAGWPPKMNDLHKPYSSGLY